MSKSFTRSDTIGPMTLSELQKLHTGSLLRRLEHLRTLEESYEVGDWYPEERDAHEAAGLIGVKNSERWRIAFRDVKTVLSDREHLPRGSKEKRQMAAREKQNR